jgi:hypothetical protein
VRITLMLDANPEKATDKTTEKKEPPLVFQTVVRLELADSSAAGGGSGSSDGSSSAQAGQGAGGG